MILDGNYSGRMSRNFRSTHKVTGADLLMMNLRYLGVAGPARHLDIDDVRKTLSSLAAAGTHTRIGLQPREGTARWGASRAFDPRAVREIDPVSSPAELELATMKIRRREGDRFPVEATICGDYLIIDVAHGLSDGKLFVDLVEALHLDSAEGPSAWSTTAESRHVIPKALFRWYAMHPARLRDSVRAVQAVRSLKALPQAGFDPEQQTDQNPAGGSTVPWHPSPAVAISQSSASTEAAVSAWRKQNAPSAGAATVALWLVRKAFDTVGLESAPGVTVAVNCRRYLPEGSVVNGNFAIGLNVAFSGKRSIEAQARTLNAVYTSGLPLAVLAVIAARVRLGKSLTPPPADSVSRDPKVVMMYSDLGRPPSWSRVPWIGDDGRKFAGLLDPAGPDAVTVMCGVVGGERTYSVSFHDNVFDREKIEKALALVVSDPLALLESGPIESSSS